MLVSISSFAQVGVGLKGAHFYVTKSGDQASVGKPYTLKGQSHTDTDDIGVIVSDQCVVNPDYIFSLFHEVYTRGLMAKCASRVDDALEISVEDIYKFRF